MMKVTKIMIIKSKCEYTKRVSSRRIYIRQGESDFCDGQNKGSEVEMVRSCKKEEHRCPSEKVRKINNNTSKER